MSPYQWTVPSTPMGAALPDSRLWRVSEGQRLVGLLRERLTVLRIARALGCADTTVHDYVRGTRCPSRMRLQQLTQLLGEGHTSAGSWRSCS
jgi:hypothetical protein